MLEARGKLTLTFACRLFDVPGSCLRLWQFSQAVGVLMLTCKPEDKPINKTSWNAFQLMMS